MYRYIQSVLQCTDTCKACTDTFKCKGHPRVSIDSCTDAGIENECHVPIHEYHVPIHVCQKVIKLREK